MPPCPDRYSLLARGRPPLKVRMRRLVLILSVSAAAASIGGIEVKRMFPADSFHPSKPAVAGAAVAAQPPTQPARAAASGTASTDGAASAATPERLDAAASASAEPPAVRAVPAAEPVVAQQPPPPRDAVAQPVALVPARAILDADLTFKKGYAARRAAKGSSDPVSKAKKPTVSVKQTIRKKPPPSVQVYDVGDGRRVVVHRGYAATFGYAANTP